MVYLPTSLKTGLHEEAMQEYKNSGETLSSHFKKSGQWAVDTALPNLKVASNDALNLKPPTQPTENVITTPSNNNDDLSDNDIIYVPESIKMIDPNKIHLSMEFEQKSKAETTTASNDYFDKTSLIMNGLSYHIGQRTIYDTDKPWNEVNQGFGLEFRVTDTIHVSALNYKNSLYEDSNSLMVGWESDGRQILGIGANIGIVTGYPAANVLPAANAYIRIGSRSEANIQVGIIPPVETETFETPAVITLQGRVPF